MDFRAWYTDTVDVWRVVSTLDGSLTRNTRQQISTGTPCRLYQQNMADITMNPTAADIKQSDFLQCDNSVDIQAGDELLIHRGAGLGQEVAAIRAFAGDPNYFFEPFGAVLPGLAHQEIRLMQQERVAGGQT